MIPEPRIGGGCMRRLVALLGLIALMSSCGEANAQNTAVPATPTVLLIRGIVETVGAVGEAIGKLTDGVRKMVAATDAGWQVVSARRTHASLIELSRSLTGLAATQRAGAILALEEYLSQPTDDRWVNVTSQLGIVLRQVDAILTHLDQERSDLVLQPAYAKLQNVLRARASLLTKLQGIPAPSTKAELVELRALLEKYRILVVQLEAARDEVNEYMRSAKS